MDKRTQLAQATEYTERGWHIIPLRPNAKTPAVASWTPFRNQHLADASLLDKWFGKTRNNVAVLTGSCSGLLVVDFDDHAQFQTFAEAHPHLLNTYAVKTRRGYHLYSLIPENTIVQSRAGQGVDLLAEGKYVVAPPSVVDDHEYRVMLDLEPKLLTDRDLTAIQRFVMQRPTKTSESRFKPIAVDTGKSTPDDIQKAVETPPEPDFAVFYQDGAVKMTPDHLPGIYHAKHNHVGRNDALFQTTLLARDHGLSQQEVLDALIDPFIQSTPPDGHKRQSDRQRRVEAEKTITSAFSRPPRQPNIMQDKLRQLPNNVIEALFALKQTRVIRTLMGLRLLGVHPGMTFTASDAEKTLKGVVGSDSVWTALHWLERKYIEYLSESNGEKVSPVPPSKSATRVAGEAPVGSTNKCILVTWKISGTGMRAERHFTMPTNKQIADLLGVEVGRHQDVLTLDDLKTAKRTREAFNRAYLKRRPGTYSANFLARRMGVCRRTLQNYRAGDDYLHGDYRYHDTPIFWSTLDAIPPAGEAARGYMLVNEWGKRFPAKRGIACKLLARGQRLLLKRQLTNYWWYGVMRPVQVLPADSKPRTFRQYEVNPVVMEQLPDETAKTPTEQGGAAPEKTSTVPQEEQFESPWAIQRCAKEVYQTINAMPSEAENAKMSLKTATRIVEKHGIKRVEKVLWRVKTRHERVTKPVGLLMTILRCEAKYASVVRSKKS